MYNTRQELLKDLLEQLTERIDEHVLNNTSAKRMPSVSVMKKMTEVYNLTKDEQIYLNDSYCSYLRLQVEMNGLATKW